MNQVFCVVGVFCLFFFFREKTGEIYEVSFSGLYLLETLKKNCPSEMLPNMVLSVEVLL